MAQHTTLRYRTLTQLMAAVRGDLMTLSLEGMIDESQLISVVTRVSRELGNRILPSRVALLDLSRGAAPLPADFRILQAVKVVGGCDNIPAYTPTPVTVSSFYVPPPTPVICSHRAQVQKIINLSAGSNLLDHDLNTSRVEVGLSQGATSIETVAHVISPDTVEIWSAAALSQVCLTVTAMEETNEYVPSDFSDPCEGPQGIRQVSTRLEGWLNALPRQVQEGDLRIIDKPMRAFNETCRQARKAISLCAWLDGDCLDSDVPWEHVLVSYLGELIDEKTGELLVLDHELVNDYYEYAIKQRIFENLIYNGEPETNKLQLVEARIRPARNNAISYARSIDYGDLLKTWQANRRMMYQKYYQPFLRP